MQDGIIKGGGVDQNDPKLKPFMDKVQYFAMNFDDDNGYENLKKYLAEIDTKAGTKGNRLFYLAVAPEFFADIIGYLGRHGMTATDQGGGWVRVIIEKPFGTDLTSAVKLNKDVNAGPQGRPGLPHRSLPRQGNRPEHPRLPLRQQHLRAPLE